jgi:hypothetical protein
VGLTEKSQSPRHQKTIDRYCSNQTRCIAHLGESRSKERSKERSLALSWTFPTGLLAGADPCKPTNPSSSPPAAG